MIAWKSEGTDWYQQLPEELHKTLKECEPLREVPNESDVQKSGYETWGKRRK